MAEENSTVDPHEGDLSTNVDNIDSDFAEEKRQKADALLKEYASGVIDVYEKTFNESIVPLLRESTNYDGGFHVVAEYDVHIDPDTEEVTNNNVTLSIKYDRELVPDNSFEYAEEMVQRRFLEELFQKAVDDFSNTESNSAL